MTSPRTILAIDLGKKGAIIAERGNVRRVWQAQLKASTWQPGPNTEPDPHKFLQQWGVIVGWLEGDPGLVVVEGASWHAPKGRKMNPGTAGRLGMEHMAWRMLLAALRVPFIIAPAKKWQKAIGVPQRRGLDVKAEVQRIVAARLPDVDLYPGTNRKNAHDGIADAAGMLLYARTLS